MSTPEPEPAPRRDSNASLNRGIAWVGAASTIVSTLDAVALMIVLHAGWVGPADYGIATLATTLFPVLDQATDLGLSAAVIQRDDHTPEKISTVFWLNLAMSLLLFGLLCVAAPAYARFQRHAVIGWMFIAYGSKLVFQNVYAIPNALMKRQFRFRELSIIRVVANLAEFGGKIGFAAAGFSVWCFVLGPMLRILVNGIGIQIRHPWRPRFVLRLRDAADYARFGIKTSASQILFYLYTNVDYQIVGYTFGAAACGLYRIAYELVLEPVRIISNVAIEIAFPTFARLRSRRAHLIEQFIAFTRQNLVVVIPFLALVLLTAEQMLVVFFSDKALPAATAARVLCAVGVFRALSFVVPPLLDGMGYPSLTLIYNSVATVVVPACFWVFAWLLGPRLGYVSVAVGWVVGYPIAFAVITTFALRRLGLSALVYLRRTVGIPACAALAAVVGLVARLLTPGWPALPRLAVIAAVTLGVLGALLARFQGISPRTVLAALRDKGAAPPPDERAKAA